MLAVLYQLKAFNVDNIVKIIHSKKQFKLFNTMRKITSGGIPLSLLFLLISVFSFGQSVLLTPQSVTTTQNSAVENIKLVGTNSPEIVGVRHSGTLASPTATGLGGYLLSLQGQGHDGTAFSGSQAYINIYASQTWTPTSKGTGIEFWNTPNGSVTNSRSMHITENGYIGIGLGSNLPTSNLHIHELSSSSLSKVKISNLGSGITDTDGLEISLLPSTDLIALGAKIINRENAPLLLGSNGITRMTIAANGNVGINGILAGTGVGRFNVNHDTGNDNTYPHLNLKTYNNASNGIIRMENLEGTRFFGQYFQVGNATPANNFVSFDYNGTTPILDMQGNGNVKVSGFTTLGNDASAPKIKMKKLSGTFSASANTSGTPTYIPHGVTDPTKIITINVLGQYAGSGGYVSNSFLTSNGYQFDYQIDGVSIIVTPKQGNSASIASQNIKVVITYEE